uniref:hypothetical protein n=1 Tax=uncultured Psychrobacter sp. TaxID=259303 RepID=UPI002592FEC8|nr:hypothetical protein [uncultured Psychrobacter sp.]
MKVKLTKKFIDSIDYTAKGTDIYMDDVLTGFALRVGKQSKRYTLHKRINGKLYSQSIIKLAQPISLNSLGRLLDLLQK